MEAGYFRKKCLEAYEIIKNSEHILLAGHRGPDGDSLGSVLGFANALYENEGKRAVSYSVDPVPSAFEFLYNSSAIVDSIAQHPDCLIGFDYGDFERLGIDESLLEDVNIISFDHHPRRGQKGDVCIIDPERSSTTELLYLFMQEIGWRVDRNTAHCLLTGIITDTGGFAYNTKDVTFNVASALSQRGASVVEINNRIKASVSQDVLNAYGKLIEMADVDSEYNFIRLFLRLSDFQEFGLALSDLSGVSGSLNRVDSVDFSIFVVEYEPSVVKGSLRGQESKGVPVAPIAERLGGGGHTYAAGFSLEMPFEDAHDKIYEAIKYNRV